MLVKDIRKLRRRLERLREQEVEERDLSLCALGRKLFTHAWRDGQHLELLDSTLQKVIRGEIRRLAIMMPPRHAKTTMACQLFVPQFLRQHPHKRVIYTTYQADKAGEWGRKCRDVIEQFHDELGINVRSDSRSASSWNIAGHRGGMLTAGVGGPLVGSGADVLIIDDPIKNHEEADSPVMREKLMDWLDSTAMTRLEPGGAVIQIMHRWRRDDMMGATLANAAKNGEEWTVLKLPALAGQADVLGRAPGSVLWPDRFTLEEMTKRRETTAPRWWYALYQQDPQMEEGAEWPASWFENVWVDHFPANSDIRLKVLALDPSKGKTDKLGDYSAYVLLAYGKDGNIYIGADMCNRRHAEQIVDDGLQLIHKHKPDAFAVETNASQELFGVLFKKECHRTGIHIRFHKQQNVDGPIYVPREHYESKVGRIRKWGTWLGNRKVKFVRSMKSSELLMSQFMMFPTGKNDPGVDDGPDSAAMALQTAMELSHAPELIRNR